MAKRPPLPRPVPVKELVQELLPPGDREGLEQRRRIRAVWDTLVPQQLRARTRLAEVRRKELWVEVSAGPWAQELMFLKPRIMEALARALGPGKILDLRTRVGEGEAESR